jgi:hypothetical protein
MEPAHILCTVDMWIWGTEHTLISIDAGAPGTGYSLCPADTRMWGEAASFALHTNRAQGKCITSGLQKHGVRERP